KYGFQPRHILVLKNQDATRATILDGLQKQLIDEAHAGDVCVFYFAGHGSQVVNSKSTEPDLKDEALVPADSPQGAAYIRDKELARLYHKALDKGVFLTVIIDSCHSRSSSRGFPLRRTARTVEPDLLDVAEKPDAGPAPEQRGALVLTAAQDLQESVEIEDDHGKTHGAFSWGLFQSLRHASVQESAEQIFSRVKA
ncbi:MAG TPA: caspase family protein, partial [Acidobacteriota bacterium]|nr:caspase family protein [Acidobacteriota bacterium]